MTSTQPLSQPRQQRRIEKDSWVPTLGPGMVLGAIGTVGLVVAMLMSWRTPDVHPSGIPFAFLFDNGTTAQDPSLLLALIPFTVLLAVGTVMPRASVARVIGSLGALVVVALFAIQLARQVDKIPGAHFGDVLDTGFYIAAIAGIVGLVSGFVPSGWGQRRRIETVDDGRGIDLGAPRV